MNPPPWHLGHGDANPYFAFTDRCNQQRPLIILASGQACVWHRLTLASKDGDWIIRDDADVCTQVLAHLANMGAHYRCGAPLDPRWLRAGWSSHFEALSPEGLRLRFDFVSHPPRIEADRLAALWIGVDLGASAVVPPEFLIRLKQTMRMKDYPFIGALALGLDNPEERLRWTLDPEDILQILAMHPHLIARLPELRPALAATPRDRDAIEAAVDQEMRQLRRADEQRMTAYSQTLAPFAQAFRRHEWPRQDLHAQHREMIHMAEALLPMTRPQGAR